MDAIYHHVLTDTLGNEEWEFGLRYLEASCENSSYTYVTFADHFNQQRNHLHKNFVTSKISCYMLQCSHPSVWWKYVRTWWNIKDLFEKFPPFSVVIVYGSLFFRIFRLIFTDEVTLTWWGHVHMLWLIGKSLENVQGVCDLMSVDNMSLEILYFLFQTFGNEVECSSYGKHVIDFCLNL